jgi:pimeloyl-ACP methyl ester carboxylesterase
MTLFVSSPPKPLELVKLLATRPRTAASIIRFGTKGVVPASKAFRRGDLQMGIRTFGNTIFGPGGFERLSEESRAQAWDNRTNVKAELLGSGLAPLDPRELRSLRIPTLLITGQKSISLFHRLADRLAELLPRVERVQIAAGGHMMHEDNTPAYNQQVQLFLEQQQGA